MLLNDLYESAPADQVKGTEKAKMVKPRIHSGSQPHPFQGRLVGGESAINELDKKSKKTTKIETMPYGNWTIDMSLDPVMMPKITGNTAMFVAKATHKKDARGVLFGKGNSQADARDDVLSQINDNLRSANPDDFSQFTIDLNVDFTKQYLDPQSGNYFKMSKDDAGQPVLVMASREYFANFGKEMEDLGFRKASSRIKHTSINATPIYALQISKNTVKALGLIPNMRYTLEEVGQDSDGNTMFSLTADTRTLGKHDKYRMGVPGLTLAASALESTMEDISNPTDTITMDIPLFIRMMEYAREDAKDDMDLHSVTDRAIALMKEHEYLCMDNYNDLVSKGQAVGEDFQWTNPNLTSDQVDKMHKNIQKTIKNKPYDVDKSAKDQRTFQQRLPQGKETAPMPVYDKVKPKQYVSASKDIDQTDEGWLDKVYAASRNFADTASLGTYKYARAGADWAAKNAMHQLGYADKGTDYQKELDQEVEKLDKDWKQEPAASLAGMSGALAIPITGEYGAAVKGAQGLAGQALDTYGKAVKMYPLAKAALGYKDMKNPKVEDVELEENLLSRIAGLVGAYYGAKAGIPDAIMSTMDMPLGTYELTQHILGGVAGYALGATLGDVAIGSMKALTKRMIRGALNKAMQAIKGGTPQEQAWKNYEAEVKTQYNKIKQAAASGNKQEPKLFDKNTNQTEGKIKGADGKACWDGYRYAGTKNGKDKCVPVKKAK